MRSRLETNLFGASSGINAVMEPYAHAGGLPSIIATHGLNLDAGSLMLYGTVETLFRLSKEGHILGLPSTINGWGNTASKAKMTEADTWLQANGAANIKRGLVGWSHGACMAVMWAAANPTLVKWIVLGIPALDLQYLRATDVVEGIAFRASIDGDKGVTYPTALPANSSPMDVAASLSAIPVLMFTCSDDDVSMNHATWRASHGNTTHVNLGALGHSLSALEAIVAQESTIVDFVHNNRP